jgi:dephospho-CoA kinase
VARWALTGGIASGKSTVAKLFVEGGIPVVDADRIYHELIAPQQDPPGPSPQGRQIDEAFPGVLRADGTVDRARLGSRVFQDEAALRRLEAVTHPAVQARAEALMTHHEALGHNHVLYDVPLLFERQLQHKFAAVVLVWVPPALQLARLLARDALTEAAALLRLQHQLPLDAKRALADYVIDNSDDLPRTRAQVQALIATMRRA